MEFQILALDQRRQFDCLSSSWEVGWRSLLLEHLRYRRAEGELVKPPRDEQTIVLVTRGQCELESRSTTDRWRAARYDAGQIKMTAPMQPTQLRWRQAADASGPFETLRLSVKSAAIASVVEQTWDRDPASVVLPDTVDTVDPIVRQTMLGLLWAAHNGVGDFYAEAARTFLITHLLSQHAGLALPMVPARTDARIDHACAYLRNHLEQPLTLDDVAAAAVMSPYHFLRVFQAQTGETPFRYLTRLRVERCQDELAHSTDTVAQIASRFGFASRTHFATAFRRHTGVSPTAWRRLHGRFDWSSDARR